MMMAVFVLIGAVLGYFAMWYLDHSMEGASNGEKLLSMVLLLAEIYAAFTLQVIIHESGHLVFGLMTGYRFSSFRVFSLMWVKEKDRIRLRRYSMAGTGGQCLMAPPDMKDGKLPVFWFNMGGSLMNVIASAIFLALFFLLPGPALLKSLMVILAVIGILSALLNGIPINMGLIANDGHNALSLSKNPAAMRAFWVQLKINEMIAEGARLKDMPEEWFEIPSDEDMKNPIIAACGVFASNRLMDERRFHEAEQLMSKLLSMDSGIIDIYRFLMTCDRVYVELMGQNRPQVVEGFITPALTNFMKQMKNNPGILRTEYALALLYKRDEKEAAQIRARFDKQARVYPYLNEIKAEEELMEMANRSYGDGR